MILPWGREHHRRAILAAPFPEAWRAILSANAAFYGHLEAADRQKLEDDLRVLIAEKNWEGHGGLEITDEIRVTVAAQACLLTLARDVGEFARVESILVYPGAYMAPRTSVQGLLVTEERLAEAGTAAGWGTVVLSWSDVLAGGRCESDGRNVVFHEFAHQLDMDYGAADGVPRLGSDSEAENWSQVMSAEYQELTAAIERGERPFLDPYGATNAAEFFAVATENFFERAAAMRDQRPALYAALRGFYRRDPAAQGG
jgi:hypothetical protein